MNNTQLAENWRAQIKDGGHGSNFFYEGKTIYSYGHHFSIAYITDGFYNGKQIILFNNNGYSTSTSKHINHVRGHQKKRKRKRYE